MKVMNVFNGKFMMREGVKYKVGSRVSVRN